MRDRERERKCKSDLSDVPEAFTMPVLLFSRSFHVLQSVSHVSSQGSIIPWHVSTVGKSSLRRFWGNSSGKRDLFVSPFLSRLSRLSEIRGYGYCINSFRNGCIIQGWFRNYLGRKLKIYRLEWFFFVLTLSRTPQIPLYAIVT